MIGAKREVAVVTGGSKGIGKAIVQLLADKGYAVAILDILDGQELAEQINAKGGDALFVHTDVSSESQVVHAAELIRKTLGKPTVLVNNAAIYPRCPILGMTLELWDQVLSVNLTGTFLCSKIFAIDMIDESKGVIVNISSERGLDGKKNAAHYSVSKAGMISLMKTMVLEWSPDIRINTILPGVTDTDQARGAGISDDELYAQGESIPLKRIGTPEDVAGVVGFLIGKEAEYITGQCICVNGGAMMH
ncbi:SDR family NAD(P)-dependent oxidoreductase [Paenibacillus sp. sgz302251]|uniref:SDR family NAD(P)-dependent oxidoreductase n=1 Tax=Paenibacillus sp. sgz302251 TaxID=3414493 RepID=UPI003C79B5D6